MKNDTKNHRFTVVIPTRERCDTLEHALHTCTIQDYDNLEIIVSDNFSQDRTREVVESYGDSRIRYINTGIRLSMTGNFELALSHVKPEGYVLYIGDDDGLLPNAIHDVNAVINRTGAQVLRWELPTYFWPTLKTNEASQLFIPFLNSRTTIQKSATAIQNLLSFRKRYPAFLPLIYQYSAVHYDVIDRIRGSSGRFYHSRVPDAYSGFAIAASVDSFVNSERPYAIGGVSQHSTAAGAGRSLGASVKKFLAEDNLPYHHSLGSVFTCSLELAILESFLQARDHVPFSREIKVDMARMFFLMMKDAAPKSQELYIATRDAVLELGRRHNILKAAQKAIAANPKREPGSGRRLTVGNLANAGIQMTRLFLTDLRRGSLHLDCSSLNVNNIYEASLLCHHILQLKDMRLLGFSTIVKSSLSHIKRIVAPGKRQAGESARVDNTTAADASKPATLPPHRNTKEACVR